MSTTPVERTISFGGNQVSVLADGFSSRQFLAHLADARAAQLKYGPFFVGDLSKVIHKYRNQWSQLFPDVQPFYAVKCNNDPAVVGLLARLGSGFDCASKKEIRQVISVLGGPSESSSRIVFSNPCKKPSHIRYASQCGVEMMTFDNECELYKIKDNHVHAGSAKLLLRIKPTDTSSQSGQTGIPEKFGTDVRCAANLLRLCRRLELDVVGVNFHVGRFADTSVLLDTIRSAGEVFAEADSLGHQLTVLDIGGGFLGEETPRVALEDVAKQVHLAISSSFASRRPGLRVIAEPGRFFTMSAFTLVTSVIGVSGPADDDDDGGGPTVSPAYTLNDGIFGSLRNLSHWQELNPRPLTTSATRRQVPELECSLWGPTCYNLDCIVQRCALPKLNVGDRVVFDEMGAYTSVLSTEFNGMPRAKRFHTVDEQHLGVLVGNERSENCVDL